MTQKRETLHVSLKWVERRFLGTNISASALSGNIMKLLEVMSRHMGDRKMIWDSLYGFNKGKSCLTNLEAFYDGVTASVG